MTEQARGAAARDAGQDPSMPMVLPVERIQPYERNPRHGANPEYDRIKASIRAAGLDQPLVVTQRPGTTDCIVHAGGNTRLQALKSLHAESGDPRYSTVPCLFRPWHRESEVLLAHLRENDLRGGLSFIDKAQAIFDIKSLLEQELDTGPISQRDLQGALTAGGYALSEGLISRMAYAVHTLLSLIPQALYAGLGKPQVERIRALDRATAQLWQRYELNDEAAHEAVFATLCRRYDSPEWDTERLRDALEIEIAELAVAPPESITGYLTEGSVLHRVFDQQDRALLFESVWTLDPGQTAYRLWRPLGDTDWGDLLGLMDTYRRIHRLAEADGLRLWE